MNHATEFVLGQEHLLLNPYGNIVKRVLSFQPCPEDPEARHFKSLDQDPVSILETPGSRLGSSSSKSSACSTSAQMASSSLLVFQKRKLGPKENGIYTNFQKQSTYLFIPVFALSLVHSSVVYGINNLLTCLHQKLFIFKQGRERDPRKN